MRVAGFANLKKDQTLKVELVLKNIEDRIENSQKMREDVIKKIAKNMKAEGINMETALQYFDTDGSGMISRSELSDGFKMMKVTLSEALIKNVFCILDNNNDNEISMLEFEAVFSQYLGTGGPV
jgi:Ca2+-binding EF-hand superfamily protein